MKKYFKFAIAALACAVGFQSCSNDDNDGPDEPTIDPVVETTVSKVFPNGLPQSVAGVTFKLNENGQVSEITRGTETLTFEYGEITRAEKSYDVEMKYTDSEYPDGNFTAYITLNENGFTKSVEQIYSASDEYNDSWEFEYNEDNQLTWFSHDGGDQKEVITYKDGNIASVREVNYDEDSYLSTIYYTGEGVAEPIENKGNIMLLDECFRTELNEMSLLYYAALLGKSTKNLPVKYVVTWGDEPIEDGWDCILNWTINGNGYPTKFWEDDDEDSAITFTW